MELKRTPEQIVIGKALNDSKAFAEDILPYVNERYFRDPMNRKLFATMNELYESRGGYSFHEVLDRIGDISTDESLAIKETIYDPLCDVSDIRYFVEQLQKARSMEVQKYLLNKALEEANEGKDISPVIDALKESISSGNMDITSIQESLGEYQNYRDEGSKAMLSTGIPQLNLQLSGGFRRGWLYIIGARSGHGKTALAATFYRNIAVSGKTPYTISLEMKGFEITSRMMNAETGLSDTQYLSHAEKYAEGFTNMYNWNAFIDDGRKVNTIGDIEKRTRYAVKKHHADIIFIDYIQLIDGASKARNRIEEVSSYSRRLKKLATEVDRPIVCLSQVTRISDQRAPIRIRGYRFKAPEMIDLSDSSSLEKDADCILILSIAENDDGTRPLLLNGQNPAILRIEKNRKGEKGHIIKLNFNGGLTSFTAGDW